MGTWKEILLTGGWVKTLLAGTLPTGDLDVNPVDRRPRLKPCQQRDHMETLLTGVWMETLPRGGLNG